MLAGVSKIRIIYVNRVYYKKYIYTELAERVQCSHLSRGRGRRSLSGNTISHLEEDNKLHGEPMDNEMHNARL